MKFFPFDVSFNGDRCCTMKSLDSMSLWETETSPKSVNDVTY